jgi:hypothetical protein
MSLVGFKFIKSMSSSFRGINVGVVYISVRTSDPTQKPSLTLAKVLRYEGRVIFKLVASVASYRATKDMLIIRLVGPSTPTSALFIFTLGNWNV